VSTPSISMEKKHQGSSPIDGKTPVHFIVGVLAGMSGLSASWAAVTVIGFEALLITLEEGRLSAAFEKRSPQSYGNQAVDIMAGIAGVYYGELIKQHQTERMFSATTRPNQTAPISPQLIAASNAGQEAVNTTVPTTNVEPITAVSNVSSYR